MSKILYILHFPPPVHGSSIVGQNIKVSTIINNAFDADYINLSTSTQISEIGKGGLIKLGRYLLILWNVFKYILFQRPNLCYLAITVKGLAFYKDTTLVMLIKLFRIPIVYHLHNKGMRTQQAYWLNNLLYFFVFKNSHVILLSKYLYPGVEKYVSKEQVFYCSNGIQEISTTRKHTPNKKVNLLFLSNLMESKGVYLLLKACNILKNKKIPFLCKLVGNKGDINIFQLNQKIKEERLEDLVNFCGPKYGKEKEKVYKEADIFVFPTYFDCFPLVLLEAMQYSLPVVSTFEGGIPDIVKDGVTGYLVPQKDVEKLADKLEVLIKAENIRNNMGQAGRKRFEEKFTIEKFENRMVEILAKIIDTQKNVG